MRRGTSILAAALIGGLVAERAAAQTPPVQTEAPAVKAESIEPKEKLQRTSEYLVQMRAALKAVIGKLEEARASKDVVKLNCVNDKLTNVKGLLRISEQADVALQEAVAKQEDQAANHEFTKVTIARGKVEQLKSEAEQCVGMLAFETGETQVTVEEPELPQTDPTQTPPPGPVVTRPPPASPTS